MDESNAIRAITIAVSTFIAILTISAVMIYYGTAKATVQAIGTGEDLSQNYADYIVDILLYNNTTDGIGAKNIINYFYLKERVSIDVKNITKMNATSERINKTNVNNNINSYNEVIAYIIPTQKFKISVDYYDSNKTEIKKITIQEI